MYKIYALVVLLLFVKFAVKAQSCIPPQIQIPDTVCRNQPFTAVHQGAGGFSYEWDFAAGDLLTTPSGLQLSVNGLPNGAYGLTTAKDGDNYFGFFASATVNSIYRLDFGSNLEGTPTLTNLGNLGLALNSSSSVRVFKENDTWIGFVSSRSNNSIFRLNFGNSLTNTPTTSTLTFPGTFSPQQSQDIKLLKEGENHIMLLASFANSQFKVVNFGSSFLNEPLANGTRAIPFTGFSNIQGFDYFNECGNWVVIFGDLNGGRIGRAVFGPSFLTGTPIVTNLSTGLPPITQPTAVAIQSDNGRLFALVSSFNVGTIMRLNFGSSLLNTPTGEVLTATGTVPINNASSMEFFKLSNSRLISNIVTTTGRLIQISFPNGGIADGAVSGINQPTMQYNQAGKYYVTLTARNSNGIVAQAVDSIVVRAQTGSGTGLQIDFITDDQCPSRPTRFFPILTPSNAQIGSYLWTFPGGFTSTSATPTRQFPGVGVYPVTMRVRSNDGCFVGSLTKEVRIFPNPTSSPVSNFTAPAQVCTFDSVQFTDASTWSSGTITRWFWDFGNGLYSERQNPKTVYNTAQTVTVVLKASDSSGCGNPFNRQISIQPGPNVNFTNQRECLGEPMQFTNQTTFPPGTSLQSYLWNFGHPAGGAANTSTSSAPQVTYTYPDTGLYNVTLRAISNIGCTTSVVKTIRVYAKPRADFTIPQITFVNQPAQFLSISTAVLQTIDSTRWNFGNPASGAANTSLLSNPTHVYTQGGLYNVNLRVVTDKKCVHDTTKQIAVRAPCPTLVFNQQFASPTKDTVVFRNQSTLLQRFNVDFCGGDLEFMPTMSNQPSASGGAPGIANASRVIPIKENGQWTGFIPTPQVGFIRALYGANLQSDATFDVSMGNPGGFFPAPVAIGFVKNGDTTEGIAINGNNRIYRMRFLNGVNQAPDSVREIILPAGTLSTPTNLHVVQDKDTIFVFVLNNNNQTSNNFIILRFLRTFRSTPTVINRPNPAAMQNATGFFSFQVIRDCNNWVGILASGNQLYRLNFRLSLNNIPEVTLLTPFLAEAGIPIGLQANYRGVNMFSDLGKVYVFVNSSNGNFIRIEFGNGTAFNPTKIQNMGSFSVAGTVGAFNIVKEGSEYFGFGINATGVIFKLRFPNFCPVSQPNFENVPIGGDVSAKYSVPGKYFISYDGEDAQGFRNNLFIEWNVAAQPPASCAPLAINKPDQICFQSPFAISASTPLDKAEWDFCTGDLQSPPSFSAATTALAGFGNVQAIAYGEDGTNKYAFLLQSNGVLTRFNINNLEPAFPTGTAITMPAGTLASPQDLKLIRSNGIWYAFVVNQTTDNLVILNLGASLNNNSPSTRTINLSGFGDKLRGIELAQDANELFALVVSQDINRIIVLAFGDNPNNLPSVRTFAVPPALNLNKISAFKQCGTWTAFVSEQSIDSLWRVDFANGLYNEPTSIRSLPVPKVLNIKAIQEGGNYYVFATTDQNNAFFRVSYGRSLSNTPSIQNFGNYSSGTNTPSLNRVIGFDLFRTNGSEHYFFGIGVTTAVVYRLSFPNICSSNAPIVSAVSSLTQTYALPGAYSFTYAGFDKAGNYIVTRDSLLVRNPAAASFTLNGNRCPGEPLSFIDNSQINVPGIIYSWDFGVAGDTSNLQFPVYTYNAPGTYTVRLALREPSGCVNRAEQVVTIFPRPIPNFGFNASGGNLCSNDSILFTDSTITGGDIISSYEWRVTNSSGAVLAQSAAPNPRFVFPAVGTYNVALQVTGSSGCNATISKQVAINRAGPLVNFNFKQPCFGDTINFLANISQAYDSLTWRLNGSVVSRQPSFTFSFPSVANYTLSLTAYTEGCTNTNTRNFNVEVKPSVNIGLNQALICRGAPISFSRQNLISERPIDSTFWNFGDGTFSRLVDPIKVYTDTGTYNVLLTVITDRGCEATALRQITVSPAPTARFVTSQACLGTPVVFTNQSDAGGIPGGITSFLWQFGDPANNSSSLTNPTFSYQSPGQYIVTLTVRTAAICPAVFRDTLNIAPLLSANFEVLEGCQGTPFQFRDISVPPGIADTAVAWDWNIGGRRSTVKNPSFIFDFTGIYGVSLTVTTKNGCTASISNSQAFQVGPPPRPDFTILDSVFASEPLIVRLRRNSNDALFYRWDFGDSSTIYAVNDPPAHLYQQEGSYIITMTAIKSPLCSVSVSKPVNVVIDQRRGVRVTSVGFTRTGGNAQIFADVENESNIALTRINFSAELGTRLNLTESWSGVLMPGASFRFFFRPSLAGTNKELIPYVCVKAEISGGVVDITPENNRRCAPVDTACNLVDAFPVPTDNDLNVFYSVPVASGFELTLVDVMGKEAYTLESGIKQPGVYEKKYRLPNLKQGLYYLKCNCNGSSDVRKIAVVR
jgi:PKD repeat protein